LKSYFIQADAVQSPKRKITGRKNLDFSNTQKLKTLSPEETFNLGLEISEHLSSGDVIALIGELGAGKTLLTTGICRGLGFQGEVTSPSYIHVQTYVGPVTIHHIDLYLDRSEEEVYDLGIDEMFDSDSIVIVEWADSFPNLMPNNCWQIEICWTDEGETVRDILIKPKPVI
jgi:tRNA threonylcarbamoyladenosine biosynthesis protein TsaE